jgi:Bacterial Ig domain/HYR domain
MARFMSFGIRGPLSVWHGLAWIMAGAIAFAPFKLSGAWVAFNDHTRGPGTGLNVSTYNLRLSGGGPLTNQATGAELPVWLQVTALGASAPVQYATPPNPGTPADRVFNGMIDFDTKGSIDNSALLYASFSQSITLTFTNLDPTQRYSFRGTSNRGGFDDGTPANNFHRRWTLCSLEGAISFTDAHSTGCVTSATLPLSGLSAGQAAYNSGMNTAAGDVVGWDAIVPSPSGSFSIVQTQYLGPIWGGDTANTTNFPGYAITGFRLEEVFDGPTVSMTSPANASFFVQPNSIEIDVTVSGFPNPVTNVVFYAGTTELGESPAAPYSLAWSNPPLGAYLLTAVAWDNTGLSATSTVTHITVTTNGPPSVILTSPADGASFPAFAPLTLSAVVSNAPALAKVEFYSNGARMGQVTSSPYNLSWAGQGAGTYSVWAVATDDLGLTTTSTVARIALTNSSTGSGTVYIVAGSDTAIWNDGSTVDVFTRHPSYPFGLFTDPASPLDTVMDPTWRNQFKDSFGQPVKFTWWMMGGNIYRDAANLNVPVNNTMTLHLMKQTQGAAIRQFGDELSLHYHTFIWSDYRGNGNPLWNQARTFEECRADFDYTLIQYLLEEEVFPVSFRSGWHYMDNDWQQYLDGLLPYSLHDNWPAARAWFTNGPINNVQDWSRAPDVFIPFHPATNDYQVPGTGPGWNVRSIKMQAMAQRDMNSIFALATNGVDEVACIWDHLPEDFVASFERIDEYAHVAAANYPTVAFRYCTAVEAMRRWRKLADEEPPRIEVSETAQGQALTLSIRSSKALFQPQPFVALRDAFGQYTNLTPFCVAVGTNAWTVALPVPRNTLAKVGIAATDLAGNLTTRILHYLPDDLYIDNLDPGYAELQGAWLSISNAAWGPDARVAPLGSNDTARVKWTLPVSRSGLYQLSIQTPPLTNAAGNISFLVWSGASKACSAAFPEGWPGGQWVPLGEALLDQTQPNWVEMTVSGANQPGTWAVADVLRMVPLPDTNAPIVACNQDIVIDGVNTNAVPVTFDLVVGDAGDPHPAISCEPRSGDLFPVGTTLVRCLATDASGNSTACTFSVNVRAASPPPCCPPQKNHLAIWVTTDGVLLLYAGDPGRTCQVQSSTNPATGWTTLSSATVPADGLLEYQDRSPLLEANFYRIVLP